MRNWSDYNDLDTVASSLGAVGTTNCRRCATLSAMDKVVAVFATCMTDFVAPGPARAAVEVIEAMGWRVVVPASQTCCGQPALNSGYRDEAARVMRTWADAFAPYHHVVSVAGSCAATIEHHWDHLIAIPHTAGQRRYEFSQFVVEHGADLDLHLEATVTYHDSCHMTRMLGERRTPRELMSRIDGLQLVEMRDSDTCCGFGGTFSVKFPEVSTAMADVKLGEVDAVAVDYVVSSDPGCMTHLAARAEARAASGGPGAPQLLHLAELTRKALRA